MRSPFCAVSPQGIYNPVDAEPEKSVATAPVSFDRVAAEYESTRYLPPSIAEATAQFVLHGVPTKGWVLDAGVGTGRFGRELARQHDRTVGIDISDEMMRQMLIAEAAHPFLARADLCAVPFASGAFARILSVHVLHLVADWKRATAELWRVTAPRGILYVGFEERERTEVREHYIAGARAAGVLPPRIGAGTTEVMAELARGGAEIREHRPPSLRWEYRIPVGTTLDGLERRTWSSLWGIPETDHRRLLARTRAWAKERFGSPDAAETIRAGMTLYSAQKR
jgi:ubiquinone/menaquinone biosynthesis C-methylase UbiE